MDTPDPTQDQEPSYPPFRGKLSDTRFATLRNAAIDGNVY